MKKKMTYVAPETEQVVVKLEGNFLFGSTTPTSSSGGSTVEDAADYSGSSIWG